MSRMSDAEGGGGDIVGAISCVLVTAEGSNKGTFGDGGNAKSGLGEPF